MKLWYLIKKHLGNIEICRCTRCKQSLLNFNDHPLGKTDCIIVIPDKSSGIYHISRCSLEHLKDTKVYKDVYGDD